MKIVAERPWIVQKYGGTSVGKLLETITRDIIPAYLKVNKLLVVCSARSGATKATGTTSLLINAIQAALDPDLTEDDLDHVIDLIRIQHIKALQEIPNCPLEIRMKAERIVLRLSDELQKLLQGAKITGEVSPRLEDRVLIVGETLACHVMATSLMAKGIIAEVVSLGNIVEDAFPGSFEQRRIMYDRLGPSFFDEIAREIGKRVQASSNNTFVVTGFFGAMPYSLLKSVGRGYSDFCAALCAVGIGAGELQVWKEVDGVFSADPSKVPSAWLLPTITTDEAAELTFYGSEIIHPLTIGQIRKARISLHIKNVMNPLSPATVIYPTPKGQTTPRTNPNLGLNGSDQSLPLQTFMTANGYHGEHQFRRTPTAITVKDDVTVVNIVSNQNRNSHNFMSNLFEVLHRHKLSVDLVTTSVQSISLALPPMTNDDSLVLVLADLEKLGSITTTREMAIISVIGHKMRNMVGIAGEIFTALAKERVNIYLIAQGASEINISFVVEGKEALLALRTIHKNVLGIPESSEIQSTFMKGPWLY